MSREPMGPDSTSLFGATFAGDLGASAAPVNLRALWIVTFEWPQVPGAVARYRHFMGPREGWFAFSPELEPEGPAS